MAAMVLCCACSFDGSGTTTGAPSLDEDSDSGGTLSSSDSGTTSGIETTSGVATTMPPGSSTAPDPTTSAVTTQPPVTTGPRDTEPDVSDESTSTDTGNGETEEPVDCSRPQTYTLAAADAVLTAPMQPGSVQGVDMVFSPEANNGVAAFSFDVECPSTYRVFARVLDANAGVNENDPDSFAVELNGVTGLWFYGCDTEVDGFSWLVVEEGEPGTLCSETAVMTFSLSAGEQVLEFTNREPQSGAAVAGIAEVVLTNDLTHAPPGG